MKAPQVGRSYRVKSQPKDRHGTVKVNAEAGICGTTNITLSPSCHSRYEPLRSFARTGAPPSLIAPG
eukprot:scaffold4059_cov177-Amphora_coffeaeformis.AAC.11